MKTNQTIDIRIYDVNCKVQGYKQTKSICEVESRTSYHQCGHCAILRHKNL